MKRVSCKVGLALRVSVKLTSGSSDSCLSREVLLEHRRHESVGAVRAATQVAPSPSEWSTSRMTQDDVLFGYRLQLVDLAARTYYRWKAQVDRQGVERLRPRERRRADAQSDRADRRGADRAVLARPPGARAAADRGDARAGGVGRAVRLAQRRVEGAAPPRDLDARSPTVVDRRLPRALRGAARGGARGACDSDRPGELVGIDCFFVGRLSYTKGAVWPVTAIDTCSSYAWVGLVRAPTTGPQAEHTIPLAQRVARELAQAGGVLQRVLTDNGNEFRAERFN